MRVTEALQPFFLAATKTIPAEIIQRAAIRGTEVHRFCARHALGDYVPTEALPEVVRGYYVSFEEWFKVNVAEVFQVEKNEIHPVFGYSGTPDLIARLRKFPGSPDLNPYFSVIDLKTPRVVSRLWAAQISAYQELIRAVHHIECEKPGSLRLHPDGKTATFDYVQDPPMAFSMFLGALQATTYFTKGGFGNE